MRAPGQLRWCPADLVLHCVRSVPPRRLLPNALRRALAVPAEPSCGSRGSCARWSPKHAGAPPRSACRAVTDRRTGLAIPALNTTSSNTTSSLNTTTASSDPFTSVNVTVLATPNARSQGGRQVGPRRGTLAMPSCGLLAGMPLRGPSSLPSGLQKCWRTCPCLTEPFFASLCLQPMLLSSCFRPFRRGAGGPAACLLPAPQRHGARAAAHDARL